MQALAMFYDAHVVSAQWNLYSEFVCMRHVWHENNRRRFSINRPETLYSFRIKSSSGIKGFYLIKGRSHGPVFTRVSSHRKISAENPKRHSSYEKSKVYPLFHRPVSSSLAHSPSLPLRSIAFDLFSLINWTRLSGSSYSKIDPIHHSRNPYVRDWSLDDGWEGGFFLLFWNFKSINKNTKRSLASVRVFACEST